MMKLLDKTDPVTDKLTSALAYVGQLEASVLERNNRLQSLKSVIAGTALEERYNACLGVAEIINEKTSAALIFNKKLSDFRVGELGWRPYMEDLLRKCMSAARRKYQDVAARGSYVALSYISEARKQLGGDDDMHLALLLGMGVQEYEVNGQILEYVGKKELSELFKPAIIAKGFFNAESERRELFENQWKKVDGYRNEEIEKYGEPDCHAETEMLDKEINALEHEARKLPRRHSAISPKNIIPPKRDGQIGL
jgi:hypothetical protein